MGGNTVVTNTAIITWYETDPSMLSAEQIGKYGRNRNEPQGGLYSFQSKFNPTIEEFAGEFNLPTNPLYHLLNLAYTIKLRSKH